MNDTQTSEEQISLIRFFTENILCNNISSRVMCNLTEPEILDVINGSTPITIYRAKRTASDVYWKIVVQTVGLIILFIIFISFSLIGTEGMFGGGDQGKNMILTTSVWLGIILGLAFALPSAIEILNEAYREWFIENTLDTATREYIITAAGYDRKLKKTTILKQRYSFDDLELHYSTINEDSGKCVALYLDLSDKRKINSDYTFNAKNYIYFAKTVQVDGPENYLYFAKSVQSDWQVTIDDDVKRVAEAFCKRTKIALVNDIVPLGSELLNLV